MALDIYQVDAFTDRPYSGNPAAVCILPGPKDDKWMQLVAREMNLSETAFLVQEEEGFSLRWFTPTVEVELCGHATLASAHTLWETGILPPGRTARFHTLSGLLTAEQKGSLIELNFPATPAEETTSPEGLTDALGVIPRFIGKNAFDFLIEAEDEDTVRGLKPDFQRLQEISVRGVIVTSRSDSDEFDFISRFFAPGAGIDEDPVTGSAHCTSGPYWSARMDKQEMVAWQASERGGTVHVRIDGDRIILGGQAVTVMRGTLIY